MDPYVELLKLLDGVKADGVAPPPYGEPQALLLYSGYSRPSAQDRYRPADRKEIVTQSSRNLHMPNQSF